MQVFENILEYKPSRESIVTIGTFDGVHIGHRKIITDMVAKGEKENLLSILLTFFPHPRMVLQKDSNIKMIDTINEKKKIFKKGPSRDSNPRPLWLQIEGQTEYL